MYVDIRRVRVTNSGVMTQEREAGGHRRPLNCVALAGLVAPDGGDQAQRDHPQSLQREREEEEEEVVGERRRRRRFY